MSVDLNHGERPAAPPRPLGERHQLTSEAFRSFVVSYGRLLPLAKPSPFAEKDIVQKLMAYSGGLTGRVTKLLAQADELAIRTKTESISMDLLEEAAAAGTFKLTARTQAESAQP
ncbi:hypothetical protein [Ideonella paludis]|uniref:Uncharacterized protein n=1 Tax=Ideonella paludis TaxID=1233411 RepID=A0ABS5E3E6_9BURK|nr:hypothetical protein [Ideonella paludis]MBQ0937940.1 hypothetical protein [Ideonella paludis]